MSNTTFLYNLKGHPITEVEKYLDDTKGVFVGLELWKAVAELGKSLKSNGKFDNEILRGDLKYNRFAPEYLALLEEKTKSIVCRHHQSLREAQSHSRGYSI